MTVNRAQYLKSVREALKDLRLLSEKFRPKDTSADVDLDRKGIDGCDLLMELESPAKFTLSYGPIGRAKWELRDASQLYCALYAGALQDISKRWKDIPFLYDPNESAKQLKLEEKYKNDVGTFKPIRASAEVDEKLLREYFQKRKASYVNVDTHGLYQVSSFTRNNFRKVPSFYSVVRILYEVQLVGSPSEYRFEMSVQCKLSRSSPYNIAPRRGNVIVLKDVVLP